MLRLCEKSRFSAADFPPSSKRTYTASRILIDVVSYNLGSTSLNVTNAQAAAVNNGAGIWAGGNSDTLNSSNRSDNVHFNATDPAAMASLELTALQATGAPFV